MTNHNDLPKRSARRQPGLKVESIKSEVEVMAEKDHVVAVFSIGHPKLHTLGIRFDSVEELMLLFMQLMDRAAEVWPDDQYIKEFKG